MATDSKKPNDKNYWLRQLEQEMQRWENLLERLDDAEKLEPILPNGWSVKDLLAHLMAWQQVTNARLEAALAAHEPVYPDWLEGASPESEDDIHQFNARIYQSYQQQSWLHVFEGWKAGFQKVIKLAENIPEAELLDKTRYPWLKGYALIAVLEGTYEHHHVDHFEALLARVEQKQAS